MNSLKRIYLPLLTFQTAGEVAYLLLGLVFGVLWFSLLFSLYAAGIGTIVVWVGLGILIATHAMLRPIAVVERLQVSWLLRHRVQAPRPIAYDPVVDSLHPKWANFWRWTHELLHDGVSWNILLWNFTRVIAGPLGFALAIAYMTVPIALLAAPVFAIWVPIQIDGADAEPAWRNWLLLGPVAFLIVAPALGWAVRSFANLHRQFATRALGPCAEELEAAALSRASVAEEQVRIDQELHDSIGHMVSMIVVQAGAGAHVFEKDPDFSRKALGNIEERGRAALGELDRIIARIRGDQVETHAPLPDARDLPALVQGARDAGMTVESHISIGDVPPALGRGVYRVVQEALTNAAKHAPGGAVRVEVASNDVAVALSVVNALGDKRPDPKSRGNGLASIRDRVTLLGGEATVGEASGGKFAVRAVLPLAAMLPAVAKTTCALAASCRCLGCTIRRKVLA